jgi:hypothetical protein
MDWSYDLLSGQEGGVATAFGLGWRLRSKQLKQFLY